MGRVWVSRYLTRTCPIAIPTGNRTVGYRLTEIQGKATATDSLPQLSDNRPVGYRLVARLTELTAQHRRWLLVIARGLVGGGNAAGEKRRGLVLVAEEQWRPAGDCVVGGELGSWSGRRWRSTRAGARVDEGDGGAGDTLVAASLWSRLRLKPLLWPGKKRWRLRDEIDSM
ncbi:unnamed protein product [Linum trigynum]|uniref:Uncharacterized protein n=1 Tax=Linum trigynum TaxID=586398 RepID=A0AAV2CLN3_9ROSI